jgi:hypothetical protein
MYLRNVGKTAHIHTGQTPKITPNYLTKFNRTVFEKLIFAQIVKKYPVFYATWNAPSPQLNMLLIYEQFLPYIPYFEKH